MKIINLLTSRIGKYISAVKYIKNEYDNNSGCPNWMVRVKLFYALVFRKCYAQEFVYFRLPEHNFRELKQFVPQKEFYDLFRKLDLKKLSLITEDKGRTYEVFKDYFGRKVVICKKDEVNSESMRNELRRFIETNGRIIIKPLCGARGVGIMFADAETIGSNGLDFIFAKYSEGFIAEELIKQSETTGKFHPKSVNTVRMYTVRYSDDVVEVMWPLFRFGRGDSIVDNASRGGIIVAIDAQTGITLGASDMYGYSYEKHPDYDFPLIGNEMPMWKQACEITREMALLLPKSGCSFVGWDMAFTDNGWVLVEANSLPGVAAWQYAYNHGIRPEFERMKKRLGVK